jgi:hypothetical protein
VRTGGKVAITSDERYILAAGPTRNATLCASGISVGCTLTYTLDPVYLHQLSSDVSLNGGGCEVFALGVNPSGQLYMSSSGGANCDTARTTGTLSNAKWVFSGCTPKHRGVCVWVCKRH